MSIFSKKLREDLSGGQFLEDVATYIEELEAEAKDDAETLHRVIQERDCAIKALLKIENSKCSPCSEIAKLAHFAIVACRDPQACHWDNDPDGGFKHYWRTGCGNHGSREGYKFIPARCPHCDRPTQAQRPRHE